MQRHWVHKFITYGAKFRWGSQTYHIGFIEDEELPTHWKSMTQAKFRHTLNRAIRRKFTSFQPIWEAYPNIEICPYRWGPMGWSIMFRFRDPDDEVAFRMVYFT
jgi:hypothetical protein